jgi:hypothetical protein
MASLEDEDQQDENDDECANANVHECRSLVGY